MSNDRYAELFWQGMKMYTDAQHEKGLPVQSGMERYFNISEGLLNDYKRQAQARWKEIAIASLESEVSCTLWYSCDKCKSMKKAIAILNNIGEINDNHYKDKPTTDSSIG
jgi:hypothetical protein